MKDILENEIKKELNFKERIIFKMFKKIFMKVYNIVRIKIVNEIIKK